MQIEPIYQQIGANVRLKRRHLQWSQERLSEMLRISRGAVANIEAGRQRIFIHQLFAIASALGSKLDDLLPPLSSQTISSDLNTLPIPADLNQRQKVQIAQMIQGADTPINK
jgi:transcriptional regulator with XRE-family HTH domain